ncbi:MAG: helix-hairpin-helix domain-containing protein [Spirochaetes bacterium]|nr:helix-hairpin-helix domain-containing protein [Spirochaetota bacterium]
MHKIKLIIVFILFIFSSGSPVFSGKRGELKIAFLDVGQGNSQIIVTPSGYSILIDGGPKGSEPIIKKYLSRLGVTKRIDAIILSNPQIINVNGLVDIVQNYDVGFIYDPGMPFSTYVYERFLETIMTKQDQMASAKGTEEEKRLSDILAAKHHYEYFNPRAGEVLDWGPDVEAVVMGPRKLFHNTRSDPNNNSIVVKLTYGKYDFLFTGDIEEEAEISLIAQGPKIKSKIVKVPNFGAAFSSGSIFLNKVQPEFAFISVGKKNPFGYPSAGVLQRYNDQGVKIYRTDLNGTIILTTDGNSLEIQPENETPEAKILAQVYEKKTTETPVNQYVKEPKMNINAATASELVSLPGIGAFKAQMIIKYRNKHGDYKSIDDLIKVPGINKAILDKIKTKITTQ